MMLIFMCSTVSHCNFLRKYIPLLNVMSYYQTVVAEQPRLRFASRVLLSDIRL